MKKLSMVLIVFVFAVMAFATNIGVMDINALASYNGTAPASAIVENKNNEKLLPLNNLAQNAITLSPTDLNIYRNLKANPLPLDAQTAQIEAFEQQNKAMTERLDAISRKLNDGTATEEEIALYEEKVVLINTNFAALQKEYQDEEKKFNEYRNKIDGIILNELGAALDKVAKEQKLDIVITRRAAGTADVVLWANEASNISSKVVEEMNKNYKQDLFLSVVY